jgi:hypothetical protein
MNEQLYLYQIIRYVPDLLRMEPMNIGVLVQSQTQVTCRMFARFQPGDKRPDFDFKNFRRWREFFETEVNGPQIPLFQPSRTSPEFLEYLQSRCKGNYIVTRPLHVTMQTENIDEVAEYLYQTLVRSPKETDPAEQPVQRFREELKERKLEKHRLLRQDEYVTLPNGERQLFHWQYDKNHGSNLRVLIEPVQWLGKIRITQIELEHVLMAVDKIRETRFNAHVIVVMDEVTPPSERAKDSTKLLFENYMKGKEVLLKKSDRVVSTVAESEDLIAEIESDLKAATLSTNQAD